MIHADVIVIGAGEAGAMVASLAVDAGAEVVLAYRDPWGSTCLNVGCVPSKFLIHRANVAHAARTADRFHVSTGGVDVDLRRIVDEKRAYVDEHREVSWRAAVANPRLTLLEGSAEFVAPNQVRVGETVAASDRIFIATGLRPTTPRIAGLDGGPWLTNETVMELPSPPEHLIVMGGGYIACELGQTYWRFGSKVTILQRGERLLPQEEPDASTSVERAFAEEGIDVRTRREARSVAWNGDRPILEVVGPDEELSILEGSHLLIAVGRRPNAGVIRVDRAGVLTDSRGYVRVDDELRTTTPGIWAIGDVNGQQPFTRVCQEEGKLAFANAFHGAHLRMERSSLPHAIFTDPEIGAVGLTERAARDRGHDVLAGLVPFGRIEKAEITGQTRGFIKYVADRKTHRLLGCHVVGPHASELVYDAVVVMRRGGLLDDLAMAVGVFPTLQEGMEGTARAVLRRTAPEEVSGPLVTARHGGGGSR